MNADHTKNIVEVRNVSFKYGQEQVLKDISLSIHKGDYLGVVGSNGAGKTTFLKIVLGLLTPGRGSVKLFGKNISEFKDWYKIGYVPQKATNFDQNFPATVKDVVLMARFAQKKPFQYTDKKDNEIAEFSLKQVDMLDFKDRMIGDLSSGQQQRVFIARALASQPEIIFLDEPTTGVDQKSQDEFYSILKKMNQEMNLTLVLITHDIARVLKEAMHIACIDHYLVCHTSAEDFIRDNPSLNVSGHVVQTIEHRHTNK